MVDRIEERIPHAEALAVAEAMAEMLRPHCERIQIAGSLRRQAETVKDIEIVAIANDGLLPFLDYLVESGQASKALYGDKGQTRWGKQYRGLLWRNIKIEVFLATRENWGYIYWLRTGPGPANTEVMKLIPGRIPTLRFQDGAAWHSTQWERKGRKWVAPYRQHIEVRDELMMFTLLGMDYVEPEGRTLELYERKMGQLPPDLAAMTSDRTVTIATGRIGLDDADAVDTTVKSASTDEGRALAPTWDMVMGYKEGRLTDAQYTDQYLKLLRERYAKDPAPFLSLLQRERTVLLCYCADGEFCHRHIAQGVLLKIARSHGVVAFNGGEVRPKALAQQELALPYHQREDLVPLDYKPAPARPAPPPFGWASPWLRPDGRVWVYVGYGKFQAMPADDPRAQTRLAVLRRQPRRQYSEYEQLFALLLIAGTWGSHENLIDY